jgi:nucleotidyltransferase substrate binding protein (TIGR01987 family)
MSTETRWRQRYENYKNALEQLKSAVETELKTDLEREGMILRFETTIDLAWKTLQDLLQSRGYINVVGPRPVLQQAFKDNLISKGDEWKEMLDSRVRNAGPYREDASVELSKKIINSYYPLLEELDIVLAKINKE